MQKLLPIFWYPNQLLLLHLLRKLKSTSTYATSVACSVIFLFLSYQVTAQSLPQPTDISSQTTRTQVYLKWTPLYEEGLSFIIERSSNATGPFIKVGAIPNAFNAFYVDEPLLPNTAYYYRIQSVKQAIRSSYSEVVKVSTQPAVNSPDQAGKVWNKTYGGNREDKLQAIVTAPDGGYLLGGSSRSGFSGEVMQLNRGGWDFWLVKTDASGKKLWDKCFGGSSNDLLESAIATADGGYLLAGTSSSSPTIGIAGTKGDKSEASRGNSDYWLVKMDDQGNKQWDKTVGGSGIDELRSVIQTKDGGYLLGGFSSSGISGEKSENSKGDSDFWLVKVSNTGIKQWDKSFGGKGVEQLSTLALTADGGFMLGGYTNSQLGGDISQKSLGNFDYWIVKLNEAGIKQWDKRFGGEGNDFLYALIQTGDGGFLMGGGSNSDAGGDRREEGTYAYSECGEYLGFDYNYWLVKTDKEGQKQWDNVYQGSTGYDNYRLDAIKSIIQTPDGGYLLGGSSNAGKGIDKSEESWGTFTQDCSYEDPGLIRTYSLDYWVIKINGGGAKEWDKNYGGFKADNLSALLYRPDGSLMIAGTSQSGANGDKTQTSRGSSDYWIIKTKPAGNIPPVRITSLTLVDADTEKDIMTLYDEQVINLSSLPTRNITIRANTFPATLGSVVFELNGQKITENASPYAIGGDYGSTAPINYKPYSLPVGNYSLKVTPFTVAKGIGTKGTTYPLSFSVVDFLSVKTFSLLNLDTKQAIQSVELGDKIYPALIATKNLDIQAILESANVGSVVFEWNDQLLTDNTAPFTLKGANSSWSLPEGTHFLKATPYSGANGSGNAGATLSIYFTVVGQSVMNFTLVNADTDQDIQEIKEGDIIDLTTLPTRRLNIRANTLPAKVGSVVFYLRSDFTYYKPAIENILPYAIGGDNYGDYKAWTLPVGQIGLNATPYAQANGQGESGTESYITFTVIDSKASPFGKAGNYLEKGRLQKIEAFPNPFADKLTVKLGEDFFGKSIQVTLLDALGRVQHQNVYNIEDGQQELHLDVDQLKPAIYFLRIANQKEEKVIKLIKK